MAQGQGNSGGGGKNSLNNRKARRAAAAAAPTANRPAPNVNKTPGGGHIVGSVPTPDEPTPRPTSRR